MLWVLRAPRTAPSAKQAKTSKSEPKIGCYRRSLAAGGGCLVILSFCHGRLGAESTAIFMIFGTPDPMTA